MTDKFACVHCGFIFEDPDMEVCPRCGTELGQEWDPAELRSFVITELTPEQAAFVATLTDKSAEDILVCMNADGCFALENLTPHQVEAYAGFLKQKAILFVVETDEQKSIRLQKQLESKTALQNAEAAKAQAKTAEEKAKAAASAQMQMEQEAKRNAAKAQAQSDARAQAEAEAEKARLESITAQVEAEVNAKTKMELELEKYKLDQALAEKRRQEEAASQKAKNGLIVKCTGIAAVAIIAVTVISIFLYTSGKEKEREERKAGAIADLQVMLRNDPFLTYENYEGSLTLAEFDEISQTYADARDAITKKKQEEEDADRKAKEQAEVKKKESAVADLQVMLRDDPFLTYEKYKEANPDKLTLAEFDGIYQTFAGARRAAEKNRFLTDVYHNPNAWKQNVCVVYKIADGVKLELMPCPKGSFMMGSPSDEDKRYNDETQHRVTLTKPFLIGKYEVTQEQYQALMGQNPSYFPSPDRPVEKVSWDEAMDFCDKLNDITEGKRPEGYQFTLPTEAQWEYACRAGTTTPFSYGNSLDANMANFDGNYPYHAGEGEYRKKTVSVGSFHPNNWGIYDMHGNVWEWCLDWYNEDYGGAATDPTGPSNGSGRVNRGGSWSYCALGCRSASRCNGGPGNRYFNLGFRVVLSAVQ